MAPLEAGFLLPLLAARFYVSTGCELNHTTRRCVVKEDDDLLEHLVYLRTVSLGEDADDETHVVAVESRNMASVPEPVPIVSLKHSVLPMVCLDGFELLPPVSFILKSGMGPVYLNGQHLILEDDSDYEPTDEDIPDDADVDEDSFDEEEIPSPQMPALNCAMTALSVFLDVPLATAVDFPLDVYREDSSPQKVCLGHAGCHTDNADEMWIPPVVQKILLQIPQDPTLDHEYIRELGIVEFTKTAMELVIGKNNQAFLDNRAGGVQTIGGTGAVWIGAEFLHRWYRPNHSTPAIIYIAEPQLGTLGCIFQVAGFADIRSYHYWDPIKLLVDIDLFVAELQNAPEGSIIFLHAPEEIGLKPSEWRRVASMMKRKHLFPFFDVAAQGLASGDLDRDAWAVRLFVNKGFELLCAQSFSKSFGLYDERVGNLIVVTTDNPTLIRIHSQIAQLIAVTWFGPTSLGARVITMVLTSPAHFYEWKQSLQTLVKRIMLIREKLKEKLRILGTPGSWEHLTRQSGVHSFIGLNSSQVEFLEKQRHIYLLANGQINICSINSKNLDYIAQSIHETILVTTCQNPSQLCITADQEPEKSSIDLSNSS